MKKLNGDFFNLKFAFWFVGIFVYSSFLAMKQDVTLSIKESALAQSNTHRIARFVNSQIIPNTPLDKIQDLFGSIQKNNPQLMNTIMREWFGPSLPSALPNDVCWCIINQHNVEEFKCIEDETQPVNSMGHFINMQLTLQKHYQESTKAFFDFKDDDQQRNKQNYLLIPETYQWDSSVLLMPDNYLKKQGINGSMISLRSMPRREVQSINALALTAPQSVLPLNVSIFEKKVSKSKKTKIIFKKSIQTSPEYILNNNIMTCTDDILVYPCAYINKDFVVLIRLLIDRNNSLFVNQQFYCLQPVHTSPIDKFADIVAGAIKNINSCLISCMGPIYMHKFLCAIGRQSIVYKLIELAGKLSYNQNILMHDVLAEFAIVCPSAIYVKKEKKKKIEQLPHDVHALFRTLGLSFYEEE